MFIKGFGSNTYLIWTSERSSILFLHVTSEVAIPSVIREEYFCQAFGLPMNHVENNFSINLQYFKQWNKEVFKIRN